MILLIFSNIYEQKCIFTQILRFFIYLFLFYFILFFFGLNICFGALVCKFGNKKVTVAFFGGIFSGFHFSVFTENEIIQFLKIVFAKFLGLITHINIKLFQTVQIQKGRFNICKSKCHLKI